jgi:hypothetical protein
MWVADVGYDWQPRAVWRVDFRDIPEDMLPEVGATLDPRSNAAQASSPGTRTDNLEPLALSANRLFSPNDHAIGCIHDQLAHLVKIRSELPHAVGAVQLLTRQELSEFIETAFWASLRSNEGRPTRVCATVAAPEHVPGAIVFATPIAYDESQVAKLAPAVPPGGCLLVRGSSNGLNIWGFGRTRPGSWIDTVSVEVLQPGTLRVGVGPFQTFAVLNGRSNPILEGSHIELPAYLQRVLRKTLPTQDILETQAIWRESLVLGVLARKILAEGHGGAVLFVPTEVGAWPRSLSSFPYQLATPDTTIRDGIRRELNDTHAQGQALQQVWQTDLPDALKNLITSGMTPRPWYNERDVEAIASLAAVDGALVMTQDLRVLGFGAKIAVISEAAPRVCMLSLKPGSQEVILKPLQEVGGTRHQSAVQFVNANTDSVALVVSHDRYASVVHWNESTDSVVVVRNAEWWM